MTVKEVATHLRMKERKLYDMVSRQELPSVRIGGKWLFPRSRIDAWVIARLEGPATARLAPTALIAGSHDPLLEWAVRESGAELPLLQDSSLQGLERLATSGAIAAGLHLLDAANGEYNVGIVASRFAHEPMVLITWAMREQGLVVATDNPLQITGVADLAPLRLAVRQKEAGSYLLLLHLLEAAGLPATLLLAKGTALRSEQDVALAVADGRADAGLAVASVARQLRLGFVPLHRERFDLLVWRKSYFEPPFQRLLALTRTSTFVERAMALGGYDVTDLGRVRWIGE